MKQQMFRKGVVAGLIVLFLGAGIIPGAIGANPVSKNPPIPSDKSFLLIPDSTAKSVGMYNPFDGTYMGDLITDPTHFSTPVNAVRGPDGDIYVSDQVADSIFVYDSAGTYLYTYADGTDGLDNIRGIDFRGTNLFITSGDAYVAEFSGPHTRLPDFIADGSDPFDILFLGDGRCLVADIAGSTDNVRLYDANGVLQQVLFSVNFPEQIQFDALTPGAYLNAAFSADVITDFELSGTIVETTAYSSGRGIFRLGNGNLLATSSAGIQEVQPGTGVIIQTEKTGSGRYIEVFSTGVNQPPNVPGNPDPIDDQTNVPLNAVLSWTGGDPDPGDFATYDVFFGMTSPPPKVVSNQSASSYTPSSLQYNEHYYWRIVAWDTSGLTAEGALWEFFTLTDTTPPTSNHQLEGTMGENNWYTTCVTLVVQATDDVSGVDTIFYKIDSGTWTEYTVPFEVCPDGQHTVYYYSTDNAGNMETEKSITFKIDKTAPTVTLTATAQNLLKTKWLLEATVEDATSGVVKVEFYVADAYVGEATAEPWEFLYQGTDTPAFAIAYDAAGNAQTSTSVDSIDGLTVFWSAMNSQSQSNILLKKVTLI